MTETLQATYTIMIAGFTIGSAEADSRFTDAGYAAVVKGTTSGISRLFSNSRPPCRQRPFRRRPTSLRPPTISTPSDSGVRDPCAHVDPRRDVTDLIAIPPLSEMPDRMPITPDHKRNILDPLGAFIVRPTDPAFRPAGKSAIAPINVFDGWQRYDIALSFKETRMIDRRGEGYDGPVFVCTARYIPIAGHRQNHEATKYMAKTSGWRYGYAPVSEMPLLGPYNIRSAPNTAIFHHLDTLRRRKPRPWIRWEIRDRAAAHLLRLFFTAAIDADHEPMQRTAPQSAPERPPTMTLVFRLRTPHVVIDGLSDAEMS